MNQTWGLIIADSNELKKIPFDFLKKENHQNILFYFYKWNDVEIIVVNSGIGIVNASMTTQKLITLFNPNKILNYGAIGGTDKLELYQVVLPNKFFFFDVETPWYPFGQTPGEKLFYENKFVNKDQYNIGTGNSFIYKKEQLEKIKNNLDVDLFDMESTAIAQVCEKNNLPFFCVKGVSDIITFSKTKDIQNINNNISVAAGKSFDYLISMFDLIREFNS